jgi:hypothetical protein
VLIAVSGPAEPVGHAYTSRRRLLDQIVAVVAQYAGPATGADAAEAWTTALQRVPMMTVIRSTSATDQPVRPPTGETLTGLLVDVLLDAIGYAPTAMRRSTLGGIVAPIVAKVPAEAPPTGWRTTANLVLLEVRAVSAVIDTLVTQVVVTVTAEPPAPGPRAAPARWSVGVGTTVNRLDAERIESEPAIAATWDQLMAGVDPAEVNGYPNHHRLDIHGPLEECALQPAR